MKFSSNFFEEVRPAFCVPATHTRRFLCLTALIWASMTDEWQLEWVKCQITTWHRFVTVVDDMNGPNAEKGFRGLYYTFILWGLNENTESDRSVPLSPLCEDWVRCTNDDLRRLPRGGQEIVKTTCKNTCIHFNLQCVAKAALICASVRSLN